MKKTIAVKEIAQFLYSSGDLTNEFFSNNRLKDGTKAHQHIQKQYNEESQKEYYVKYNVDMLEDTLTIHGFIDGVLNESGEIVLQEIKSTTENLDKIDFDYHKEHLAQLKLYAFIYADVEELKSLHLRLTYITIDEYNIKNLDINLSYEELKEFFYNSITEYYEWLKILDNASNVKMDSLKNITFPFVNKRPGQQELMKATYMTLSSNSILYAIAPTGIGKTMATLFSALKSIKKPKEKLFYLTAKTMGRNVAVESIKLLQKKGLNLKSIVITSKAKSCLLGCEHCDPEKCPFAKGYFNNLRKAIEDIYNNEELFTYEIIKSYALKHKICAFEFTLDLSYFCDVIICDYNYAFDPKARLIRYFEDSDYEPKLLCDEAHNLVERSKEMYSAYFDSYIPANLEELVSKKDPTITRYVKMFYQTLDKYDELINEDLFYYSQFLDDTLISILRQILNKTETILSENKEIKNREEILTYYFAIKDFIDTSEYFSTDHFFIIKKIENNHYNLTIKCCDASEYIYETITQRTKGVVFFSATLFPIKYYMDLLTKGNGKYLTLPSPFPQENLNLIIKDNISTRYKDRENTIDDIVDTIKVLLNSKKGNHIAFFPSYRYIELVSEALKIDDVEIIVQKSDMSDFERNEIFDKFKDTSKSHLGLFVMGGSFSEGVDFVGDLLNGVIIVGVGLPQINVENNLLKEFFEEKYGQGFDYAYTYPGFNKVVQAAGRVIRTEFDRGSVILLDERYRSWLYKELMPLEWSHRITINNKMLLENNLNKFYRKKEDKND